MYRLVGCLINISASMNTNHLTLNPAKTQILASGTYLGNTAVYKMPVLDSSVTTVDTAGCQPWRV